MANGHVLAIDVGATVVRAGIYDMEGRCPAIRTRSVDIEHPEPGHAEVNATAYYDAAAMVSRRALRATGKAGQPVVAVCLSCQMGGLVGVDEDCKPVTRFDPHLDTRCQPVREELMREHESTVRKLTGCLPYLGVKIRWWQDNEPAAAATVRTWLTIGGYLVARMAGLTAEQATIDRTNIGLSGLADSKAGAWTDTLLDVCGVDREVLPRIVEATEVMGQLTAEAAPDFGLPTGVPVVAGLADHAATFLGASLTRPGRLCDLSANICHFAAATDRFAADDRHRALSTIASPMADLWYAMAYINAGGTTYRWFLDAVCQCGGDKSRLAARARALELEAAGIDPGADGLLFVPHLDGRHCPWDPVIRGSWLGLRGHHAQKHLYRSILESVAFEYAYFLQIAREVFEQTSFDEIYGIGGGTRSRLWSQIKADVLGLPYVMPSRDDHALLGAAAVGAAGVGAVAGVGDAIDRWSKPGARLEPDRDRHREYAELFKVYVRALNELRSIFKDLRDVARRASASS